MNSMTVPASRVIALASARREWLSHRLNRFLHAHLALVCTAAVLPLLAAGNTLQSGASWWMLHAVLYAISLSAFLLGLSSAHAEAEEFVWLLGQPAGVGPWLMGKFTVLVVLAGASAGLLGLPAALAGYSSPELALTTAGAAGVGVFCAIAGLATGFWIRDSVRGLIVVVALWMLLLFGTDLLLLAIAGSPIVQQHPDLWATPLMLNPLDAFRIMVLFAVERAAFSSLEAGTLAGWWANHAPLWLAILVTFWTSIALLVAWRGARRPLDA